MFKDLVLADHEVTSLSVDLIRNLSGEICFRCMNIEILATYKSQE